MGYHVLDVISIDMTGQKVDPSTIPTYEYEGNAYSKLRKGSQMTTTNTPAALPDKPANTTAKTDEKATPTPKVDEKPATDKKIPDIDIAGTKKKEENKPKEEVKKEETKAEKKEEVKKEETKTEKKEETKTENKDSKADDGKDELEKHDYGYIKHTDFLANFTTIEAKDKTIVVFMAGKDKDDEYWCPDCSLVGNIVHHNLTDMAKENKLDITFVDVGDRDTWKDKENTLRTHPNIKLTNVPTVGLFEKGKMTKKFIENDILKEENLKSLFT